MLNEEFLITWENTLINGEGHRETKLRIWHAITFNNQMHSRKESCRNVCCYLYEGIMGDFYLLLYFFLYFLNFPLCTHILSSGKKLKLYEEIQSFDIVPLDMFMEHFYGHLPRSGWTYGNGHSNSRCFYEWHCGLQYWVKHIQRRVLLHI